MKSNMPSPCLRQSGSMQIPLTTGAVGTHPSETSESAEPALTTVQRETTLEDDKEKKGSSPGLRSEVFSCLSSLMLNALVPVPTY